MYQDMSDSRPIVCGQKKKGIDWLPLKALMKERLGYVPSLSIKLSRDELNKLGFKAAANGLYPVFQGGLNGRRRDDGSEEGVYSPRS